MKFTRIVLVNSSPLFLVAINANVVAHDLCLTTSDAYANVTTVSGGTSTYYYTWYAAGNNTVLASTSLASSLTVGDYVVNIASGICDVNFSTAVPATCINLFILCLFLVFLMFYFYFLFIFVNVASLTSVITHTDPKCPASSDGTVTVTASGGNGGSYVYTWIHSGSTVSTSANSTNFSAGNYTLKLSTTNYLCVYCQCYACSSRFVTLHLLLSLHSHFRVQLLCRPKSLLQM
jgi:SprB repeat